MKALNGSSTFTAIYNLEKADLFELCLALRYCIESSWSTIVHILKHAVSYRSNTFRKAVVSEVQKY